MEAPIKPMPLSFAEAKQTIINNINDVLKTTGMPIFMLEIIIKDLYEEIKQNSIREYEMASSQYQQAMAEYKKSQETKTESR